MSWMQRVFSAVFVIIFVLSLGFFPQGDARAAGSISLTAMGTSYTQDFNTLANTPATPPAYYAMGINGWYITETGTSSTRDDLYNAGTGSSTSGDTYSFGASGSTERALGAMLSNTLTPTYGGLFVNNTGATIGSLAVSYTGEEWRLGATGRADRIDFQYSLDATSLTSGTWVNVDALDFSTPLYSGTGVATGAKDGNNSTYRTALSSTISGLNIANGASFWIRWADYNPSGSDDGLAVDDFSLTPAAPAAINLSINDVSASEGDSGTTTFTFTVSLSAPAPAGGVTFDIATQDNTALAASDYTARSLTAQTMPAGTSTYTFNVLVTGDTAVESNESFYVNVTNSSGASTIDSQGVGTILNDDSLPIHTIQGASHTSAYAGQTVSVDGIVTALRTAGGTRGLYVQEPDADADADLATSEGIFVFTGSTSNPASMAAVGDKVRVSGLLSEYRSGGASSVSLTLTEITGPTVVVLSTGNPLPTAVVIGTGGRIPPAAVIDDDAAGSVETGGSFDAATDGIDFYESMENMLVQVNDAVAVGPYTDFTSNHELAVVGDNGANADLRTPRGGIVLGDAYSDFNPERIILNDWITGGPLLPAVDVGASFPGAIKGVLDYSFNNFKLQVISMPTQGQGSLAQEVSWPATGLELSVGTFNVENLAPTDSPAKFSALAILVVDHLWSPDILAIEEIQDNSGATNNGVVAADVTWGMLISAIQAAGGPTYAYRQVDPVDGQDGGAPGGNIRVGFLFRTDRGVTFVDRPGAGSTTANAAGANPLGGAQLLYSPGRINPASTAFSTSRKPLAAEFSFRGETIFVVANHFNSKGGDDPLYGRYQPPTLTSEAQRLQQATEVRNFVQSIYAVDPGAHVIVAGDLNDFQFSPPLTTLEGAPLHTLIETLPANERYTYVYDGNSQAIDHILLSPSLYSMLYTYDVVHVNSEFAAQISDHEPQVVRIKMDDAPTVFLGGYTSPVNGSLLSIGPTRITVQFDKDVLSGGGPDAADNPVNYLLVEEGSQPGFQTVSCAGTAMPGDTVIPIQSVMYSDNNNAGPFIATLAINNGIPLPDGSYMLLICGTTSVRDAFGNALNAGADTRILFRVGAPLPDTGFAPGRLTVLPEQPAEKGYTNSDMKLEIPRLGVLVTVLGVPSVNGSWDVSWLGQSAGWLDGSAFPTWAGNSVLTAHVWNANNTAGSFSGLDTLYYGDPVIIHAFGQQYLYEVRTIQRIRPDAFTTVFQHEELPWLSLLTCQKYDEKTGEYLYRTLVRAVQVGIK